MESTSSGAMKLFIFFILIITLLPLTSCMFEEHFDWLFELGGGKSTPTTTAPQPTVYDNTITSSKGPIQIGISVGTVEVRLAGSARWFSAPTGTRINYGDQVRTRDDGRCEVKLPWRESVIRMESNASLVAQAPPKEQEFTIEFLIGKFWASIKGLRAGDRFIYRTPNTLSGVKGTEFEVIYDGSQTTCNVINGVVEISDSMGKKTVLVKTGQTSTCKASGLPSEPVTYDAGALNPWWLSVQEQPSQSITGESKSFMPWIYLSVAAVFFVVMVTNTLRIRRRRQVKTTVGTAPHNAVPDIPPDPRTAPVYCKNCGVKLEKDTPFCSQCGTSVREKAK